MIAAGWLHQAAVIALVIWGPAHGCKHVHQQQVPLRSPPGVAAQAILPYGTGYCAIQYNSVDRRPWSWARTCAATIHEWGHLTGHGHSRDPASPMYPVLHADPQCDGFGWPYLRAHLVRWAQLTHT